MKFSPCGTDTSIQLLSRLPPELLTPPVDMIVKNDGVVEGDIVGDVGKADGFTVEGILEG